MRLVAAAVLAVLCAVAQAQPYPNRPITIISPFPPQLKQYLELTDVLLLQITDEEIQIGGRCEATATFQRQYGGAG